MFLCRPIPDGLPAMSADRPVFRKPRRTPEEVAVVEAAETLERVLEDCPRGHSEAPPRVPAKLPSSPLVARISLVSRIQI